MSTAQIADLIESAVAAERAGEWDDALRWYESAFSQLGTVRDGGRAAELLRRIGRVHNERGDLETAEELFETSLAVARACGLREHEAYALNSLAVAEQFRGRIDRADELYARARSLAEAEGIERLAAMIDQNRGTLANIRGEVQVALTQYRSALERFRRIGDELACAWALNNMGMAQVDLEEWRAAERCFAEAFELADRLRDMATLGSIELNRAELYLQCREFERAREGCDRAFEIFGRLESNTGRAEACKFYGILFRETSKPKLAEEHLARAVELARGCRDPLLEAECERETALLHLSEARNREALHCLNRAHRLFSGLEARREILDLERRLDRLEEVYLRVVRSWGESIESQDRYTAGHCQRVADYACRLAEEVGFGGRDLVWFRMGAFLHDVGKTIVPPEVLNSPGKLTPEQWELMKSHTVAGDEIVAELDFPWDIRPMVRSHHEHWDGSGYPDGLAGEEIPVAARILCVADVFDALTTKRSYRAALPRDEALRIMEREAGRTVDPELFRTFRGLIETPAEAVSAGD